ncbi:hypothetical protein IG631_07946 [Alternaria alternata]|nr:hypothetical protein IG631_07946 [Alternaria alternata]
MAGTSMEHPRPRISAPRACIAKIMAFRAQSDLYHQLFSGAIDTIYHITRQIYAPAINHISCGSIRKSK